ncbi:glutamate racemase [Candidatus Gracilibacteria bacterium]|nr:glutamate racemase [Candidatus Gracilibacteria bacterium]
MIGIFDSGYGGLTVMKEIVRMLPQYDYLYLGDNARTPYGNRSKETIIEYTDQAVRYLFERGARLIVVACFTATSQALRELQEKYLRDPKSPYKDRKILGVVRPVVEKATQITRSKHIGIIGTRGTIASHTFDIELKKLNESITATSQACPLLVPFIEEGWHKKPEALSILKKYLRPLKAHHIDTLLLGCTHYPLMIQDIRRIMGKRVKVMHSGEIVAESLVDYLKRHPEIETQLTQKGTQTFLTTDDTEKFKNFAQEFAHVAVSKIEKISL